MVMVPPLRRIVCVVKVTVVTVVVACSAFWYANASISTGDWTVPFVNAPELTVVLNESAADWTITSKLPTFRGPAATLLNVHTLADVSHTVVVWWL